MIKSTFDPLYEKAKNECPWRKAFKGDINNLTQEEKVLWGQSVFGYLQIHWSPDVEYPGFEELLRMCEEKIK